MAKEIIRLRLQSERLDRDALRRHLADAGFSTLLTDVDRAASHARAPFADDDVTLAAARTQWSRAFEVLNREAALTSALEAAKPDPVGAGGDAAFMTLKAERDLLRRAIRTGTLWHDEAAS